MQDHRDTSAVIDQVIEQKLTYLKREMLEDLAWAVEEADANDRVGDLIECGTALGGSAIVIASAKAPTRPLRVYDLFGMIPPPTEEDGEVVLRRYEKIRSGESKGIGGDVYYGYRDDLLGEVTASFERLGLPTEDNAVELVAGNFSDTLHVDSPVALAHLDGDWYESTMTCLTRIWPHLVLGGRLILDDYFFWDGCRRAVDEFFGGRTDHEFVTMNRLHVVRTSSVE